LSTQNAFFLPLSFPGCPSRPRSNAIFSMKTPQTARCQWLMSVILATQEAEIRSIEVQSQPGLIVLKILSRKKSIMQQKGWWSGSRCRP
jgi:hypothetical protein